MLIFDFCMWVILIFLFFYFYVSVEVVGVVVGVVVGGVDVVYYFGVLYGCCDFVFLWLRFVL